MAVVLVGDVHWKCEAGHHGAGPRLPDVCPLGFCGAGVAAYGRGSKAANAAREVPGPDTYEPDDPERPM
jgi:hypothetical protein